MVYKLRIVCFMTGYPHQKLTIMERISLRTVYRDNGCWEYHGHWNSPGYGQIHYQDKHQLVHRISFKWFKGKIPEGKFVLHRCDNPKCYNPDHLFLGTQQNNIDDMIAKKKASWQQERSISFPETFWTMNRRI